LNTILESFAYVNMQDLNPGRSYILRMTECNGDAGEIVGLSEISNCLFPCGVVANGRTA